MAHQCWNDGTDRSTLPIHGTQSIGNAASRPEADSRRQPFFSGAVFSGFHSKA